MIPHFSVERNGTAAATDQPLSDANAEEEEEEEEEVLYVTQEELEKLKADGKIDVNEFDVVGEEIEKKSGSPAPPAAAKGTDSGSYEYYDDEENVINATSTSAATTTTTTTTTTTERPPPPPLPTLGLSVIPSPVLTQPNNPPAAEVYNPYTGNTLLTSSSPETNYRSDIVTGNHYQKPSSSLPSSDFVSFHIDGVNNNNNVVSPQFYSNNRRGGGSDYDDGIELITANPNKPAAAPGGFRDIVVKSSFNAGGGGSQWKGL
jgi:hypothetical protein